MQLADFPDYFVSTEGRVLNGLNDKILKHSLNQRGIPTVGMFRDGIQFRRAVPVLVANCWVPNEEGDWFDTIIHLDGDRQNCCADNLMWRPRWFAIEYHKERQYNWFPDWKLDFELLQTQEIFHHPRDCAMKYGLLERSIFHGLLHNKAMFPFALEFRLV